MVLYYKASQKDVEVVTKEEVEEEKREEIEEETKEESWDELVCEPPGPVEIKSMEDEKRLEEPQDQDGKEEDNQDKEVANQDAEEEDNQYEEVANQDAGDNDSSEASEESSPLRISENKKVTAAKAWTKWEMGCWAQVPQFSGRPSPRMGFYRRRGQRALRWSTWGKQRWRWDWRAWSLWEMAGLD